MLLALAKIVSRFLALMALIVAVLWWRSARHIDVLRFDWSPTEDHSVSLISPPAVFILNTQRCGP